MAGFFTASVRFDSAAPSAPFFHEFVLANGVEVVGVEGGVALAELFEQGSDIWGGSGGGSGRDPGEQER